MKMKWSVIVLIVLGLLAAFSTAILVGVLRTDSSDSAAKDTSSNVSIILAKTSLPAMSVISAGHITMREVPKKDLPEGYMSNPVQVVGRILATSVVDEQILTESCFVTEGSAAQLAAAIPHGMRAISVMLSSHAITGGLLYPGSIVDILASFRLSSRDRSKGQAISTTLLQGIQVLAVENATVVSTKEEKETSAANANYSSNKQLMITLMVNSKQAEALQLAMEYGSISIAMRNPLDRYAVETDTTVLSEGQLAKFGSVLTPGTLAQKQKKVLLGEVLDSNSTTEGQENDERIMFDSTITRPRPKSSPRWGITVIRGQDVQTHQLDIPKQKVTSWVGAKK